jgi:hypothetical protein
MKKLHPAGVTTCVRDPETTRHGMAVLIGAVLTTVGGSRIRDAQHHIGFQRRKSAARKNRTHRHHSKITTRFARHHRRRCRRSTIGPASIQATLPSGQGVPSATSRAERAGDSEFRCDSPHSTMCLWIFELRHPEKWEARAHMYMYIYLYVYGTPLFGRVLNPSPTAPHDGLHHRALGRTFPSGFGG